MKTPQSKTELTKDGKPRKSAAPSPQGAAAGAGFAVAKLSQNADGTWLAVVNCINGDPNRKTTNTLPKGITYFGGKEAITGPSEAAVFMADGTKIDTNYLFPWGGGQADPLRLGGGKIKGDIVEGAQRVTGGPKTAIQAPFIMTEWVNGTAHKVSIFLTDLFGMKFYEGDVVFALVLRDPVADKLVIKALAKKEGPCLDNIKV